MKRDHFETRARRLGLVALATGALLLSACSAPGEAADISSKGDETTTISIAFAPVADFAPVYVALDQGYFEDEGLRVETQTGQNAAAVVPAVLNGQLQIAASAVPPFLTAIEKGLPLVAVANASSVAADAADDPSAIVVQGGSEITRAKDLAGATVAVNQLGSLSHVTAAAAINADGGDYTKTTFVAMPFPDMAAALDRGTITAAAVLEPFLSLALAGGAKVISSPNSATLTPDGTAVIFFTSKDYAQKNKQVIEKFKRAVDRGSETAAERRDLVGKVLEKYANLDPKLFAEMRLPHYSPELSGAAIQQAADLMKGLGMLEKPVDVDSIVWK